MGEGIVGVPEEEDAVARLCRWDKRDAEEVGDWHKGERERDTEDCRCVELEWSCGGGGHFGGYASWAGCVNEAKSWLLFARSDSRELVVFKIFCSSHAFRGL